MRWTFPHVILRKRASATKDLAYDGTKAMRLKTYAEYRLNTDPSLTSLVQDDVIGKVMTI